LVFFGVHCQVSLDEVERILISRLLGGASITAAING